MNMGTVSVNSLKGKNVTMNTSDTNKVIFFIEILVIVRVHLAVSSRLRGIRTREQQEPVAS